MKNWNIERCRLYFLILLYFLVRIPLILSPLDRFGTDLDFFWGERIRGTIAVEFINGFHLPFLDYLTDPYGFGVYLAGLWTVPFFALFGKTLFALKLAPLFWHLFSLLAWYFVFRRQFSPWQTFGMLLFLALPPPAITKFMLFNIGYHFEMILWSALSLILLRRLLEGSLSARRAGVYLGLLNGLSSLMVLTNLATAFLICLYLFWVRSEKIRKGLFFKFYLPTFFVCLIPLFLYNWHDGWQWWSHWIQSYYPEGFSFAYFLKSFYEVLLHNIRDLFLFPFFPSLLKKIFMDGFALFYLFSLLYLFLKKKKGWLETFGLLFQLLLLGIVVVTHQFHWTQYLFPMVPFMGMTMVLFISRFKKVARVGLALLYVGVGIAGNFSLVLFHLLGATLSWPGYSYEATSEILQYRLRNNCPLLTLKMEQLLKGQSQETKRFLYQGISEECLGPESLDFIRRSEISFQPILFEKLGIKLGKKHLLKQWKIDSHFWPAIAKGVVQGILEESKIDQAVSFCKKTSKEAKRSCYKGLGLFLGDRDKDFVKPLLEKGYWFDYLEGMGEHLHNTLELEPQRVSSLWQSLQDSERKWFLSGLEEGIAKEEDPYFQMKFRQGLARITLK